MAVTDKGLDRLESLLRMVMAGLPEKILAGEEVDTFQSFPDQATDYVLEVQFLPRDTGGDDDGVWELTVCYRGVGELPLAEASGALDVAGGVGWRGLLETSSASVDFSDFADTVSADLSARRPDLFDYTQ